MKSLLNKRLPGILALGLVALAVGAAGATSGATAGASNDAAVSGLTAAQKKAKAKALKKCKKIKKVSKRKACIKKVKKKYSGGGTGPGPVDPGTPPIGANFDVAVEDDFYDPATLTVKSGDQVSWIWNNSNANPHNVTLAQGPPDLTPVEQFELSMSNSPATQYTFKRQLVKPGDYDFYCTLHSTVMKMKVTVTK